MDPIMVDQERKQCHFRFKAICGLNRVIDGSADFVCHNIFHQKRMVKSTYVIKNRFIKAILF